MELSAVVKKQIDHWVAKFPAGHQRGAVLAALRLVQADQDGSLSTEAMDAVAAYLDLPPIFIYEVASFYTLYHLKPVGRHCLYVCSNVSCLLRGCEEIIERLEDRLGIRMGETTPDGRISLFEVECLGACGGAPALQVGTDYHENMTVEKVDHLLEGLK